MRATRSSPDSDTNGADVQTDLIVGPEQLSGAAEGAGHVRREPRVETAGMEHVAAVGDHFNRLRLTELAQADRALLDHPVLRGPTVRNQRQRINGRAVQSSAAALAVRRHGGGGGGGGEAADVDGEEGEEEESGEEDQDCEGHGGVEDGGSLQERRSSGSFWIAIEGIDVGGLDESSRD